MNYCKIYQLSDNYIVKVEDFKDECIQERNIHNILLCDSSGSMASYWKSVSTGWNNLVKTLEGTVTILLFDTQVYNIKGRNLPENIRLKALLNGDISSVNAAIEYLKAKNTNG
jgi:hypothetical protein